MPDCADAVCFCGAAHVSGTRRSPYSSRVRGSFLAIANVCSWHIADVQIALMNVRFEGNNGHDVDAGPMSANDPKRTLQCHL